MDIATLLGILGAFGILVWAIYLGGDFLAFLNIPSIVIVFGGTFAATLTRISLAEVLGSFHVAARAFLYKSTSQTALIEEAVYLADVARKQGILALEGKQISHPFLKYGINLCIDGYSPETVQKMLTKDINLAIERHETGVNMFRSIGDAAPAMGMIGTLVGLIQMLGTIDDPKKLGPAMAIALLTTLYGAVIANCVAFPLADKLKKIGIEERLRKNLILESVSSIQAGVNPRVVEQMLATYLPEKMRDENNGVTGKAA